MAKQGKASMLSYPLLSGKLLGDATKQDLNAEAREDTEMEAIIAEMATNGVEDVVITAPDKAARLATYLARCVELAPARALARASNE